MKRATASLAPRLQLLVTLLLAATAPGNLRALVISELMYHSEKELADGSEDKRFEWIEVYNENDDPIDLSGFFISRGVTYEFEPNTILRGRSYLVIASAPEVIQAEYGMANVVGPWTAGALDNGGEDVAISTVSGAELVRVDYNDRGRWPAGADGTGHTLALRDPYLEIDDPDSWAISTALGGTPGSSNFEGAEEVGPPPVMINEGLFFASGDRWVELYNTTDSDSDLSGFFLTDDRKHLAKSPLPPGSVLPARGWLAFTDAELGLNFSLSSPEVRERVFVALVDSSGNRVIDAYSFEPKIEEKSEARIPDGDEDVENAAEPTPGAANVTVVESDIVINEIMYHAIHHGRDGRSDVNEFVEIFNRGNHEVDLTGWSLTRGVDFDFPPGLTIGVGEYLVVARDRAQLIGTYDIEPDRVIGPTDAEATDAFGGLRDRGERLNLRDANGNLVDTVRYYDGGEWPRWADGGGSSLELIDPYSDNNIGSSWDASDDSDKAVVDTFSYSSRHAGGEPEIHVALLDRGITIVDDLSVRDGSTELVPNPSFDASADGWRIEGNHVRSGLTTDGDEVISGGSSLKLIATGRGDNKVNRVETDISTMNTTSAYTVSFDARWVVGAKSILTRGYNHGLAKRHVLSVPKDLGTPGAINSVTQRQIDRTGSSNLGPVITKVSQNPPVPENDQDVQVRAKVVDRDGIAPGSVRLFWALESKTADFTDVVMDGPDPDGRYSALIPGQSVGTKVLFYLTALDTQGQEGRFPVDPTQRSHALMVDPDSATAVDFEYCVYRHDNPPTNSLQSYRFLLDESSETALRSRRILSNELLDGSFIFGFGADRVYYNSKVRYAGSPWLRPNGGFRKSYRLSLPKDKPLHGRIRGFNVDNHLTDGRERLSYHLIRYNNRPGVGVPYSIPWLVRWQLNTLVTATYEHVARPDSDFLRLWFAGDADGDLFEVDDRFEFNDGGNRVSNRDARVRYPPYDNTPYLEGDRENWRWFFNSRTNRDDDNYLGLQQLSFVLDPGETSDSAFDSTIENTIDVEEFLRVFAVRFNTDDWDTWGTERGKNCYLYQRPIDGRWHLLPWDMELTYEELQASRLPSSPFSNYNPGGFNEVNRLVNRPRIKRMYYRVLKEMVDSQFNSTFLAEWVDANLEARVTNINYARPNGYIDRRRDLINGWIRGVTFPQQSLTISTEGGAPFVVNGQTVSLAGTAPVEIVSIQVLNGGGVDPGEAELQFTGFLEWKLDGIPILPGPNDLELIGLDGNGNIVDTTSIEVTSTVNWQQPVITDAEPNSGAAEDRIDVLGDGFHNGIRVFFNGIEGEAVAFEEGVDSTRLQVTIPGGLPLGMVALTVRNVDGQESTAFDFLVTPELPKFIRGDANLNSEVEIGDVVTILMHTFRGLEVGCRHALDVDDNGDLEGTDATYLLGYLFREGAAPAAPFPDRGRDATTDNLDCDVGI